MGVGHYENFPVASLLVPPRWRAAIREIYRFARTADDIADEGDAPAAQRLEALGHLRAVLREIEAGGDPRDDAWVPLARQIRAHQLPTGLFGDLLSAFEQDARGAVYRDYEDLFAYCRLSANPVGRLLLALYGRPDAKLQAWSDGVCTGLQLVNMWQDIAVDHAKGRIYLPQSEFVRFGVDPRQIARAQVGRAWSELVCAQTAIARAQLLSGRPLARALGGRIGWELRLVIQGGLRIAARIDAVHGDIFRHRPTLNGLDWLRMAALATAM